MVTPTSSVSENLKRAQALATLLDIDQNTVKQKLFRLQISFEHITSRLDQMESLISDVREKLELSEG